MKTLGKLVIIAASTLSGISLLAGCGGFAGTAFPAMPAAETKGVLGTIRGSDFGGHAPLVGAHLYVLQAGTTGYGSQATSLISSAALNCNGSSNQICQNTSDPGIPASWYYETTDSSGAFSISGDYTCTVGHPVYLYAYGGSPTFPSGTNIIPVTSVTVADAAETNLVSGTGTATYTVNMGNEGFYIGEIVTLAGFTGNLAVLNGPQAIAATGLTTATFQFTGSDPYTGGLLGTGIGASATNPDGTQAVSGVTATGAPTFNPGVVNLAVLGNCPNGSTNAGFAGTLQFVYLNEVSTVAAAYALEGFTASGTNNTTYIGASAENLTGIANAALVAGQLYDIQGGELSTSYAGEGHIARLTTSAGNGNVPQATLDSIANMLAACVDSNSTTALQSAQCITLFATATSNGIPSGNTGVGTLPVDTAQAAMNIAHNPAGAVATATTFLTDLFTLPTGNVPFTPHLTVQPNDFTVAIQYPQALNAEAASVESISIDGNGNVWMNSASLKNIFEMNPVGVVTYTSPAQTYSYGYVSVDPSNNVWAGNNNTTSSETKIVTSGTVPAIMTYPVATGGLYDSYMTVAASNGNIYMGATPSSGTGNQTQWASYAITTAGGAVANFPVDPGLGTGYKIAHGAVENVSIGGSGDIWWTTESNYGITRFNPTTGTVAAGFPVTNTTGAPEMPSIDASGNAWVALQQNSAVEKISPAGVVTTLVGGSIATPFGVTVDGAGNVFVGQRGGTSVAEYNNAGTILSPAANYTLAGQLSKPLNLAMDQSGNLWITAYDANTIVQWVGAGAPLTNPLSYASGQNKIGARP